MDIAHTDQPTAPSTSDTQHPTPDTQQPGPSTPRKPLRLWPGVAAAVILAVAWFIMPYVLPDLFLYGLLASLIAVVAIILWWLLFSRARWYERLGALALIVLALWATSRVVHISIRTGSMGFLFPVLAVPVVALAFVAWAAATRRLPDKIRRISMVATIFVVCAAFTVLRTGGFTGDFDHDFQWRWSKTPEERLLAQADEEPLAPSTTAGANTGAEWPGFRGADRDGVVRGTRIKTDWSSSPPVELWRRPIGPGWSSFAVSGDRVYTQEQRGADEIVACYDIKTGKPVWRHRDSARFWESNAGPGPRGTPTLSNGRVYTLGATGILNVLDASNGKTVWSRNAVSDTGAKVPIWGFSSSPLIVDDLVVVATASELVAYDIGTGKPRWLGPDGGGDAYSSPHLLTINGVRQILLLREQGVISVAPSDGKVLWEHAWEGVPIVQPAITADGNILVSVSESSGTRSLAVTQQGSGWSVQERWTSEALNPYYNDFVIHDGYAYGFDWNTLTCIDLKDGNRKWKGGRYGHGQLVLLRDQNVLLVLAELGDLALVKASPDGFTELARIPAIKGKTWNHPVLAGDVVLVRNGEEMAAFKLPGA